MSGLKRGAEILSELGALDWFQRLNQPTPQWSLLVRVGSRVRFPDAVVSGDRDEDIFLVIPAAVQEVQEPPPVTSFRMDDVVVEVSLYTTERLIEDALSGGGVVHWRNAQLLAVGSADEQMIAALAAAGRMTLEHQRRRAWTQYVLFEIQASHSMQARSRSDASAEALSRAGALIAAAECALSIHGYAENSKWIAHRLREVAPDLAAAIDSFGRGAKEDELLVAEVGHLRTALRSEMAIAGFSAAECEHWDTVHAPLLEFQMPSWVRNVPSSFR